MKSYFTNDELKCKCCGEIRISPAFLEKLNLARSLAGFAFIVSSGYRCPKHNAAVGSTSTNHTSGQAADILCPNGFKRYEMTAAMMHAGMLGIGIGETFIHCDINRTTPNIWIY